MPLEQLQLPGGRDFIGLCARRLLALAEGPDLSSVGVILPSLTLAPALRAALAGQLRAPALLPSIETLPSRLAPWLDSIPHLSDSRRKLALYQALRERQWFDRSSLWGVSTELVDLFDELTLNGVGLPSDVAELAQMLAGAYGCHAEQPLRFEARLAVELWRVEGQGEQTRSAARLLAARHWAASLDAPLLVIAEGPLGSFEEAVYAACGEQVAVTVCQPQWRRDDTLALLDAAWPASDAHAGVAARLAERSAPCSMRERLGVVACDSLEAQASAAVAQVHQWLIAGRRQIALVAVDRVAARRARALLERDRILVADETGWKFSTTRAAAFVDAVLETLDSQAYHRNLADLLKSPFVCSASDDGGRSAVAVELEQMLAGANLAGGWEAVEHRIADSGSSELQRAWARVQALRDALPLSAAPPGVWLKRLEAGFEALDARSALAGDAAGAQLLDWLQTRSAELSAERVKLAFGEWRQWLDAELDAAMFRDSTIDSPVVMTHLAATRLRSFEAVLVVGADAQLLSPATRRPVFAHERVREELGLGGRRAARERLRDDLAGLIANSDECVFVWQQLDGSEARLLNAELELLSLAHELAFCEGLHRPPDGLAPAHLASAGPPEAAPVIARQLLPEKISPSGFASVLQCPYQYYAGRLLGLGAADEVSEEMEKRDYGDLLHRVLRRAHQQMPLFSEASREEVIDALDRISEQVFADELQRNFMATGWLLRWRALLPAYVDWQCDREADGWCFAEGEIERQLAVDLAAGRTVKLHGRLDRLDRDADGRFAVIDYKARSVTALRRSVADQDDVQLAMYVLLADADVREAAYLSLDEAPCRGVPLDGPDAQAQRQLGRLRDTLEAIHGGLPMVANGDNASCSYCDMAGLCRREHRA